MKRDNYFYKIEDDDIRARYRQASERIAAAAEDEGLSQVPVLYRDFFRESAEYLSEVIRFFNEAWGDEDKGPLGADDAVGDKKTGDKDYFINRQRILWRHILAEGYEESYLNPRVAVGAAGHVGGILSAVYADLTACNRWIAEGRRDLITMFMELWIGLLSLCENGSLEDEAAVSDEDGEGSLYNKIKTAVRNFYYDFQTVVTCERIAFSVDPKCDRIRRIIMESDLSDPSYLYEYGTYIGENEISSLEYLRSLPEDRLQAMADTLTEGYRIGFEITGRDLSIKKAAELVYPIGFEPMVRRIVDNLAALGLSITARPEGVLCLTGRGKKRSVFSTSANKQFDYDHKDDRGYFYDEGFVKKHLTDLRNAYESLKDEANTMAGPAVIEVFGEPKFTPVNKPENYEFTQAQNELNVYETNETGSIINEYIPGDERSFSIIAYPLPCIGDRYGEIFDATVQVNTLDYMQYRQIQQHLIDALDQGVKAHVVGCNGNITDITVVLHPLKDPDRETIFENCVADVNIPVGEVFTSPVLEGTNGTLFVSRVYLGDYSYDNLRLDFKDGRIVDYTCDNYDNEDENKKLIFDRILYKHDTLPMGEFAIGTNTTAYVMARRFGISDKLPILIAEKTGPHFAVGDTCYDRAEDVPVFNPDGKEIIARDNSITLLRKTDPSKAYFNCHTDITIPFEELGLIEVIRADGSTIDLIRDGRFVLPGTEALNVPLEEEGKE